MGYGSRSGYWLSGPAMTSLSTVLSLLHLIGLAFALGAATVKVYLVLRCLGDRGFIRLYLLIVRPITRIIVLGLVLLTLSGITWLLVVGGYELTPRLIVKLALVGVVWIVGPIIDNAVEPEYRRLAPGPNASASPDFARVQKLYLGLELFATGVLYGITVFWVVF